MNEETPERSATPPVLPADDLEARTVRWPTVLGVISIVYGILALIGNGCGAASPLSTPFFLQMAGMDAEKMRHIEIRERMNERRTQRRHVSLPGMSLVGFPVIYPMLVRHSIPALDF